MIGTSVLTKVDVALSPVERFEEFLQSRGKRVTRQRRTIVEEVFRRHEHFDADALLAHLQKVSRNRAVSKATVYRTLAELVEAGLLRSFTLDGRRDVFEHDYGYPKHDHLHCEKCGQLVEFHSQELEAILSAVAREHEFRMTGHRLILNGVCPNCSRPRRSLGVLDRI